MEELFMEFYTGKAETAFLEVYQEKYGKLTEDQIDDLYADIADTIDKDIDSGKHTLGEVYTYQDVELGKSDYNSYHNLYIFGK